MGHANRSKKRHDPCYRPSPGEIRAAREWARLDVPGAARRICGTVSAWENWERDPRDPGYRQMHSGLWRLFLQEIGLDPDHPLGPQIGR